MAQGCTRRVSRLFRWRNPQINIADRPQAFRPGQTCGAALYDGWRVEALVRAMPPQEWRTFLAPQERTGGVRTLRALCAVQEAAQ